nr:protein PLASTID MOVEMENT IMPAIRED 1-RELATED 1-like isoform X1 [Ipomoea batatas]
MYNKTPPKALVSPSISWAQVLWVNTRILEIENPIVGNRGAVYLWNFNDLKFVWWKWKRKEWRFDNSLCSCLLWDSFEFGETLMPSVFCAIGSRMGPQHSAKYEPKAVFWLQASVIGVQLWIMGNTGLNLTSKLRRTQSFHKFHASSQRMWTRCIRIVFGGLIYETAVDRENEMQFKAARSQKVTLMKKSQYHQQDVNSRLT